MLDERRLQLVDAVRRRVHRGPSAPAATLAGHAAAQGRPLHVAVARFDGIGDWVLTLPLIGALREAEDVAEITAIGHRSHLSLLERLDGVAAEGEDVWASHHTPWPHGAAGKVLSISALGQGRALRAGRRHEGRFDLVVVPRWDTDRGQNTIAFAAATRALVAAHDPALQPQATRKERADRAAIAILVQDPRPHAHEGERLEALSSALGLTVPPGAGTVRALLALPIARTPEATITVHTGAHDAFRRWPQRSWVELVDALLTSTEDSIVLIGGRDDAADHGPLVARDPARVRSVAGELPLRSLPDLLDTARLMIGGDSGPAHIAAAIGVPTLVVSSFPEGDDPGHPNSPDRFGPRSAGGTTILRPPPSDRPFAELTDAERGGLLAGIRPTEVHRAAMALLAAARSRP